MEMPADLLRQEIERFMNIGFMYQEQRQRGEPGYRLQQASHAEEQIQNAREVIASINDQPLPLEHWQKVPGKKPHSPGSMVKQQGRQFHFTFNSHGQRTTLYNHLYDVVTEFMNKLPVSARWLVQYRFGERWFSVPITKDTLPSMLDQIKEQVLDVSIDKPIAVSSDELDTSMINSDNPFICHIQQISEIHFIDITAYADLMTKWKKNEKPKAKSKKTTKKSTTAAPPSAPTFDVSGMSNDQLAALIAAAQAQLTDNQTKTYKTREGAFFKYLCTLPINLEKFQIFNRIDKRVCNILDEDNCVVWALKQAGVDPSTVEHVKELIGSRYFPKSKFQLIADETGIAFHIRYYRPSSNRTDVDHYSPQNGIAGRVVNLVLLDDHYLLDTTVPISPYAIEHLTEIQAHPKCSKWTFDQMLTTTRFLKSKDRFEKSPSIQTPIMSILKLLFEHGHFREIHYGDFAPFHTCQYKQKVAPLEKLEYNPKWCARLKEPYKKNENKDAAERKKAQLFQLKKVVYADFECSTDGIHKPYNLCAMTAEGEEFSAWGEDCAKLFLNWNEITDGTQIYFHNLSYDINFIMKHLDIIIGTPIIKSGRTLQIDGKYKGKCLRFKDSLAIISKRLEMFPEMFGLKDIQKEVFPYTFYDSEHVKRPFGDIAEACEHLKSEEDRKQFRENIKQLQCEDDEGIGLFDLEKYSTFYCMQDVRILRDGFERFRSDLLQEFDIDAYHFVSISSIANRLFEKEVYWKNKNLYDLAGTPREFISRAVLGGRVMMAENQKQQNYAVSYDSDPICDFDAVSLYPSAISRLYTVEAIPKVIPGKNIHWLIDHLMDDEQEEPTIPKFISAFVVEIEITKVNKPRKFPLIVYNEDFQVERSQDVCHGQVHAMHVHEKIERSSNRPCRMYVDHITLMDLIKYQEIEFTFIRGYYWDGRRDFSIRDCIKNLFNLRLKYKAEGNPVQEIIKLIMNSVYGKTILKPIDHKIVFKPEGKEAENYLKKNYNTIESIEHIYGSHLVKFKKLKPINDHFNFCLFGVNILSMSKRIMNEVMCLAEDNAIPIFYQDTDSMHLYEKDVPRLAELFKQEHGRELIGKQLGQFHSDFATIVKGGKMPVAIRSIFCGKKSYIDMLRDDKGNIGFHARMKGVPMESIAFKANSMFPQAIPVKYDKNIGLFMPQFPKQEIPNTILEAMLIVDDADKEYSIMDLYQHLYDGQEATFDLCAGGRPCFDMKDDFSILTKTKFERTLKF